MARLAEARLSAGQRWRAQRGLQRALRLAEASPMAPHLVVRVYAVMVETAASAALAADVVTEAETALAGVEVCQSCSIGYRVAAARRLAEAGDLEAASVHLEAAGRIATMWPNGPWAAEVLEARALVARAEGRQRDASGLLAEAAVLYVDAGFALHAARCRSALEAA